MIRSLQSTNQVLKIATDPYLHQMTSLHQRLNQETMHERESAAERLQSRWSSKKTPFVVDRPPSQPLSHRRQMNERPISGSAVKEIHQHMYPGTGNSRARRSAVRTLQQSGSRWSSGSQAAFDTASPKALVRRRMIVRPSSVSALKHSAAMKNHNIFETTIRPQSLAASETVTRLQCAARSA
jgi:hypothetical protein